MKKLSSLDEESSQVTSLGMAKTVEGIESEDTLKSVYTIATKKKVDAS